MTPCEASPGERQDDVGLVDVDEGLGEGGRRAPVAEGGGSALVREVGQPDLDVRLDERAPSTKPASVRLQSAQSGVPLMMPRVSSRLAEAATMPAR